MINIENIPNPANINLKKLNKDVLMYFAEEYLRIIEKNKIYKNTIFLDDLNIDPEHIKVLTNIREGESNKVEFKSSFKFPWENIKSKKKRKKKFKKSLIFKIFRNIISMINAQGGNIYVGIIENDDVIKGEYKGHTIKYGDITFLDVDYSMKKFGLDLDSVVRSMQINVENYTNYSIQDLDSYFSFKKYCLMNKEGKTVSLVRINVTPKKNKVSILCDSQKLEVKRVKTMTVSKRIN